MLHEAVNRPSFLGSMAVKARPYLDPTFRAALEGYGVVLDTQGNRLPSSDELWKAMQVADEIVDFLETSTAPGVYPLAAFIAKKWGTGKAAQRKEADA